MISFLMMTEQPTDHEYNRMSLRIIILLYFISKTTVLDFTPGSGHTYFQVLGYKSNVRPGGDGHNYNSNTQYAEAGESL